jgi:alkylhydroperoxidase family enzyme
VSRPPRAPLLDPSTALRAAQRSGVPEVLARLNVFRVLLANEPLAKSVCDLLLALLSGRALDPRLRELVIMRIGWSTASEYEWTQHWHIATGMGVPATELLAVRNWQEDASFGALERAVLEATDESLAGRRIPDGVMAELEVALTPDAVVELVAAIAAWTMVSTLLRSLEIPLEDGIDAWPPDGASPP